MTDYKGQPDHWSAITVYNMLLNKWEKGWSLGVWEYDRYPNSEKAIRFKKWWDKDIEETIKLQKEKLESGLK